MDKKPAWLKKRLSLGADFAETERVLQSAGVNTVCSAARCPNRHECYGRRVATFMILGEACTRRCRFCAVTKKTPCPPDPGEPDRVAAAAAGLQLRYVVVTSVTRDDLPDRGAGAFVATMKSLRRRAPGVAVEILTPDFGGDRALVGSVIAESPAVFNHNLETVPRLYPAVRPGAGYRRSLSVLAAARAAGAPFVKSGLMLGLGETRAELEAVMGDLLEAGCRMLTLGQYLSPGEGCLPVTRYLPPEEFAACREKALEMGFAAVASGPFVRSSHFAGDLFASLEGNPVPRPPVS